MRFIARYVFTYKEFALVRMVHTINRCYQEHKYKIEIFNKKKVTMANNKCVQYAQYGDMQSSHYIYNMCNGQV